MSKWDLPQEFKVGLTFKIQFMQSTIFVKDKPHMAIPIGTEKPVTKSKTYP